MLMKVYISQKMIIIIDFQSLTLVHTDRVTDTKFK